MKIQEIDIKNFRGYGEAPNESDGFFKFKNLDKPDIVLITGHNGYGKTSLYEAIEWCMTDDIKALRKHTENVNQKTTLKKSHYLKFQSIYDDNEQEKKREVIVRIIFDNGRQLIRKTTCGSLHENEYSSSVMDETGKIMREDVEKNEVKLFIKEYTGQPVENLFRLNFCGQAYTQDLVSDTNAKERGGIWLSFLGMNVINDIIAKSDAKSNPNLSKKCIGVTNTIKDKKSIQEKINELFQMNNWGTIDAYCNQVNEKIKEINNFEEELKRIGIKQGLPLKTETVPDIVETIEKSNILSEKMQNSYNKHIREKENCVKERFIREYMRTKGFLHKAEIYEQFDLGKHQLDLNQYLEREETYQKTLEEVDKRELEINNCIIAKFNNIQEVNFLTKSLVQQYENAEEIYNKIYLKSQQYGLTNNEKIKLLDIRRIYGYSKGYENQITTYKTKLDEMYKALRDIEGINQSQKDMLLSVQSFVNRSENVKQCPVCGSKEFYGIEESAKDKLLAIIENKIAAGNDKVKKYNTDIISLESIVKRWEMSYNEKVWKKYVQVMDNLERVTNKIIQEILCYLCGMKECNQKMLNTLSKKREKVQKIINDYNSFISEYDVENRVLEKEIVRIKKVNQNLEKVLEDRFQISLENIENTECKKIIKIKELKAMINIEGKVIKLLEDVQEFDLGKSNLELLNKYAKHEGDSGKLEKKEKVYKKALEYRANINKVAKNIQNDMLKKYIENNRMINVVYGFINPHPFFRTIKIDNGKSEMNIKSTEREDVFLDHVFSEAQMKVLSLSIFLGLNLSVKNSRFEQIYIDDPVQSMDDINMVSFIDFLRAIRASKNINKNFIIGTHDDNFSKLLKIKFRYHTYIEYHFEAYSKEGPVIRTIEHIN